MMCGKRSHRVLKLNGNQNGRNTIFTDSLLVHNRLCADKIVVMHKGKESETGTHQELPTQRGIYWKLYQVHYK